MKQIKTLMVAALTLIMGVMMTSCLDSEGGETLYDGYFLAKVVSAGSMYGGGAVFQDAGGNTFNASYSSVAKIESGGVSLSDIEMGFIYYKWSVDENGEQLTPPDFNAETPQTYQIELVAIQEVPTEYAESLGTVAELEESGFETSPIGIANLSGTTGNSIKFDYYGDDTMLYMYIQWLLTNGEEEFKKHTIRLVYITEEITSASTELRFYLCHDNGGDEGTEAIYPNWYCFRIEEALAYFESVTGAQPATIKLSLYEDTNSSGYMPASRTDYILKNE